MVHSLTRNGMSGALSLLIKIEEDQADMIALHSDLTSSLDRMSITPSPQAASAPAASFFTKRVPKYRHKQVRVLLSIRGIPRLPPHNVSSRCLVLRSIMS